MPPLLEISKAYFSTLQHFPANPFFWVVLGLVAWQFYRLARLEQTFYGRQRQPLFYRVLLSLFFGLLGGWFGSLIVVGVGITISFAWVRYVLAVSVALAIINMRFICFSYSGGLLALLHLLTGWPELDVASLLGLVAVLHIVESVLMLISGHLMATPVAMRQPSGRIVGAYNLQMFWPLPLLALIFIPGSMGGVRGGIGMPMWWPLIRPVDAPLGTDLTLWMVPLLAGLGYGDLAVTVPPRQKVRQSAWQLLAYSLLLLLLAWLGSRQPALLWLGAIFAPLGHEALIQLNNRREQRGEPRFGHLGPGVQVMEVLRDGVAERAGLQAGDIILRANGQPVETIAEIRAVLRSALQIYLTVVRAGREHNILLNLPPTDQPGQLGILLTPDATASAFLEVRESQRLKQLWQRIFRRRDEDS
ncbi:MAG: PDZ domain-containing protein [Bacillota bacterium]|jgi:hypothetical protein